MIDSGSDLEKIGETISCFKALHCIAKLCGSDYMLLYNVVSKKTGSPSIRFAFGTKNLRSDSIDDCLDVSYLSDIDTKSSSIAKSFCEAIQREPRSYDIPYMIGIFNSAYKTVGTHLAKVMGIGAVYTIGRIARSILMCIEKTMDTHDIYTYDVLTHSTQLLCEAGTSLEELLIKADLEHLAEDARN